ncbi:hypothetical protein LCGC14_2724340 [marine sediment metagenome]|uniref:Uncharacterized protein n=1 Tax=marine sediment metagenome TaxID=412755 RepID=A0A0F8Z983_9ZZZZ
MSTLTSDQLTNDAASPPVRGDFNKNGSALRYKLGVWTITAAQVTSEEGLTAGNMTVQMVTMPKGAIVNEHLSYLQWNVLGTTVTFDVGDGDDQDRYMAAIVGGTASTTTVQTFEEAKGVAIFRAVHEYTAEDTIDLVNTATISTLVAGRIVQMHVFYTVNG